MTVYGVNTGYVPGPSGPGSCSLGSWAVDPSWPDSLDRLSFLGVPTTFVHHAIGSGATSYIYAPVLDNCVPFSITATANMATPVINPGESGCEIQVGMAMTSPPSSSSSRVYTHVFHRGSAGFQDIPFGDVYLKIANINGGALGGDQTIYAVPDSDVGAVSSVTQSVSIRIEVYEVSPGDLNSRFKYWMTSEGEPSTWMFTESGSTSGIPAYVFLALASGPEIGDYVINADLAFTCGAGCQGEMQIVSAVADYAVPIATGYVPG